MELQLDIGYKNNALYTDAVLSFPKKGIVTFIGENGSGKSTIYKTLLGMIPSIRGSVPSSFAEFGAIISDYVHIPEEISVADVLALLGREKVDYVKHNYCDLYNYVSKLSHLRIKVLSSGQKRIVEIFTVLSSKKKFIFLDEATNALDFKNKQLFLRYVKELSDRDVLFFHTTHDLSDVIYLGGIVYGLFKSNKKIIKYEGKLDSIDSLQRFLEY